MKSHSPSTRKRGEDLEFAILEATWAELVDVGYAELTLQGIANRSSTSRSVINRRWQNKEELVGRAIAHYFASNTYALPNEGTLRDDLIDVLKRISDLRAPMVTILLGIVDAYLKDSNHGPETLREAVDFGPSMDPIFLRAIERGEIDAAKLTSRIKSLPFDLLRSELLKTRQTISLTVIKEIVDEIFLPLVAVRVKS